MKYVFYNIKKKFFIYTFFILIMKKFLLFIKIVLQNFKIFLLID